MKIVSLFLWPEMNIVLSVYLKSFRSPGFRFYSVSCFFLALLFFVFFVLTLLGLSFMCISAFLYFFLSMCFPFYFLAVGAACFVSMFFSLRSSLIISLNA
jgi:hypothetical protein